MQYNVFEVMIVNASDNTPRTRTRRPNPVTERASRAPRRFRVLLLEPPNMNGDSLAPGLSAVGYEVKRVSTTCEAFEALFDHALEGTALEGTGFDLALFEVHLPDAPRAGLEVLHAVRQHEAGRESALPVVLIGRSTLLRDRLVALDAGCDDYLVRPIALEELHARVRAVLRRAQPHLAYNLDAHGQVHLDWSARVARVQDRLVPLSPVEFDLLELLASRPGQVFSRRQLATSGVMELQTVIEQITSIRRKLGAQVIETVRGRGYRLGIA